MKRTWIILAVLLTLALVSTVSAFGSITFPYNGKLTVKYVANVTEAYNNAFGIDSPIKNLLGYTINPPTATGTVFMGSDVGDRCTAGEEVVVYMTNPFSKTFYSNRSAADGLDHAHVSGPVAGVWTVQFEDIYGHTNNPDPKIPGDGDFNDVIMAIACTPDTTSPIPEFPAAALPVALIVGLLGAVFYIKSTENK